MPDIKSFLVSPPDDPAINHPEILDAEKLLSQPMPFSEPERQLSKEEMETLHEAMLPDSEVLY